MNNNTLLGIYADIQEIAEVNVEFHDIPTGTHILQEKEEEACRRASRVVKAIHSEPDSKPPKQPTNWLKLQKEEEYIPKEIGWAMTFYQKRTNLKKQWTTIWKRVIQNS